jgi:hypothetical protein
VARRLRQREGVWLEFAEGISKAAAIRRHPTFNLQGLGDVSAVLGLHLIPYILIRLGNLLMTVKTTTRNPVSQVWPKATKQAPFQGKR